MDKGSIILSFQFKTVTFKLRMAPWVDYVPNRTYWSGASGVYVTREMFEGLRYRHLASQTSRHFMLVAIQSLYHHERFSPQLLALGPELRDILRQQSDGALYARLGLLEKWTHLLLDAWLYQDKINRSVHQRWTQWLEATMLRPEECLSNTPTEQLGEKTPSP